MGGACQLAEVECKGEFWRGLQKYNINAITVSTFTHLPLPCFHCLLCNVWSTVHIHSNQSCAKARAISQFLHLCSGLVQIRFVAAELIRQSFTLCVLDGFGGSGQIKRWKIHGWGGTGESRAWHWASALGHHADQGSQRDSCSPLKGLCWAYSFSPFMHGNKTLAVTVSAGFYDLLSCHHCSIWVPFSTGQGGSIYCIFLSLCCRDSRRLCWIGVRRICML